MIEPVDALRRIAFVLERARAGEYRVKAFRQAVNTVVATPREELHARAAAGTLSELPGIGRSTEAVILQALAGRRPEYLDTVEAKYPDKMVDGGEQLRSLLHGDCHSHSDWSDGGSPIPEMVATAMELGHDYLVLTDHSPRLRVANGLSAARLDEQLGVIEAINRHLSTSGPGAFTLLKGIEVDILDDGSLDQTDEMLDRLDLRVASVHSKLAMPSAPMTARMIAAVRNPRTDVLGHCTGRLTGGSRGTRPPSSFDARAVFEACAENDVAVEINSRPERCDPPDDLMRLAVDAGCLFSIDSDAHAPGQLDLLQFGCARAEQFDIPPERVVNTWEKDRLLEWAARR